MLLVLYNANAPLRHTMIPMTDAVYIVEEDAPVCNAVRRCGGTGLFISG
ncbi:MAG: hypothetical protein ACXWL9_03760 [Syntrophales bacterium]